MQHLLAKIPKAQIDSQIKQLFALLGSADVKAVRKYVDEIDPRRRESERVTRTNLAKLSLRFTLMESGRT